MCPTVRRECPDVYDASSSPSFAGATADGSSHVTALFSKGGPLQKATSRMEVDTTVPSSASSRGGALKGSFSDVFRPDHWRGLRRKKPRPDAPRLEAHRESSVHQSSDSPELTGWRDWSDRAT